MDFIDEVTDFGAKEIIVTGVACVERISKGQVRVTYFISRKGENMVAVHLLWDCELWLETFRLWQEAHGKIERECVHFGGCSTNEERRQKLS